MNRPTEDEIRGEKERLVDRLTRGVETDDVVKGALTALEWVLGEPHVWAQDGLVDAEGRLVVRAWEIMDSLEKA